MGSGELIDAATVKSQIVALRDTSKNSFTASAPCGTCVSLEECTGSVELWHHKCLSGDAHGP